MPASEISLQTEAELTAMQDHQVHLQYLTEEHLGKFHCPNVTAKKSCQWFENQGLSETEASEIP